MAEASDHDRGARASARLDLVVFGGFEALLPDLVGGLRRVLGTEVVRRSPWFDLELAYDRGRGQYNSLAILRHLLADPSPVADVVLAVVGFDLFSPVLTFVFGEAQLGGRASVVSIHRLKPESYGLPPDRGLLVDRLIKEAVHEVGHTRGLIHCFAPACVMRTSTYVEEIDLKNEDFCPSCRAELAKNR